jgi:hypothetical protein
MEHDACPTLSYTAILGDLGPDMPPTVADHDAVQTHVKSLAVSSL